MFIAIKSNKISVAQLCQFGAEVQSFEDLLCIHHQGILKTRKVCKTLYFTPNWHSRLPEKILSYFTEAFVSFTNFNIGTLLGSSQILCNLSGEKAKVECHEKILVRLEVVQLSESQLSLNMSSSCSVLASRSKAQCTSRCVQVCQCAYQLEKYIWCAFHLRR
jgi:hypothetical protein